MAGVQTWKSGGRFGSGLIIEQINRQSPLNNFRIWGHLYWRIFTEDFSESTAVSQRYQQTIPSGIAEAVCVFQESDLRYSTGAGPPLEDVKLIERSGIVKCSLCELKFCEQPEKLSVAFGAEIAQFENAALSEESNLMSGCSLPVIAWRGACIMHLKNSKIKHPALGFQNHVKIHCESREYDSSSI